ncbi:fimbria/pilus periplasmic chaperone [Pseudomonas sp. ITA]|uniref:fimbrial biogenesis chaperone n=1 Tax=Pseudomonas sp. ITA TaxID=2825841 RepID=UPI002498F916|nr:fimbria/pilus periplasmic chaperone [Pseudomonas sp. ITA]MDI2145858.1 fimbria/pilus periplasmic chaperone [Pseudomonas sp. ITA]
MLKTLAGFYTRRTFATIASMVLFLFAGSIHASVIIDGTRVIYPEQAPEVTVRLTNKGELPRLVQAWIDDGDEKSSPEKIDVPFVILTPIFRMEANKGQVLRVRYTKTKPLPQDRESVFWLNVLEIPAKPSEEKQTENYLQFSFRTRIKLFLRPAGLPGTAANAAEQLTWKYQPGALQATNPTAFNVSIKRINVGAASQGGTAEGIMVAPFSSTFITLKDAKSEPANPQITFYPINDFGGTPELKATAVNATFASHSQP